MTLIADVAAILLITGGGTCLYLATPHQRLLGTPLPRRPARAAGWIALLLALAILLSLMGPATAIFAWIVGLMVTWTIPPIVFGWLRYRKETRP